MSLIVEYSKSGFLSLQEEIVGVSEHVDKALQEEARPHVVPRRGHQHRLLAEIELHRRRKEVALT